MVRKIVQNFLLAWLRKSLRKIARRRRITGKSRMTGRRRIVEKRRITKRRRKTERRRVKMTSGTKPNQVSESINQDKETTLWF